MSTIGERVNPPRCQKCGKPVKEARFKLCYDCNQAARSGNAPSSGARGDDNLTQRFAAYLTRLRDSGFFDEKGNLQVALRVEDADMVAQVLSRAEVATGQIRKFFTMARSLEQRLNATGDFDAIVPDIASLQTHAAAVIGKAQSQPQQAKLQVLRDFIDSNATLARQNEKSFRKGFLPHFESVIAYFTLYKPR